MIGEGLKVEPLSMSMRLCWNGIVRNESARILRAAASVAPHISCYVITDTGSTDNTAEILKDFFRRAHIPGEVVHCEFENFSQARNVALFAAVKSQFEWDYALLMDADMQLQVLDPSWLDIISSGAPSFDMMQVAGTLHYANRRLVRRGSVNEAHCYLGVTHEFLNTETGGCVPITKALFVDHADGANRPDKVKRDIKLLKKGLEQEPGNVRYLYYLAQSYRDAGKFEKAIKWYQRRIDAGGWDQECWSAQYSLAACHGLLGNEAEFLHNMLAAYNMRPTRAEPLHDLAAYFRGKDKPVLANLLSQTAIDIPRSDDQLFVNDYVYSVGALQEFSISAFYVPHPNKRAMGYKTTNQLMLKKSPYAAERDLARTNMWHYLAPLKEFCPSYASISIDFTPPENWIALNPSIAYAKGELDSPLYGVIRTVNYRIDDQGRYIIRGTDGTCNATNPINTRNYLARFSKVTLQVDWTTEIKGEPWLDAGLTGVKFDLVRGYEDMRLYTGGDNLWVSATVREIEADGPCEQVRVRLDRSVLGCYTTDLVRMLRRGYEKNWMPIEEGVDGVHRFLYRCDEVVDGQGVTVVKREAPVVVDTFAGGSQAIKVNDGYLAVVHEARQIPGAPTRFYMHRFVAWDKDFNLKKVSPPFYLDAKGIEYVAGLVMDEPRNRLILSFGFKDCEARLATVSIEDVTRMLWVS